jgi:hypothetical protein
MRHLALLAVLFTVAACGTEISDPQSRADDSRSVPTPTAMPTEILVPDGPVTTRYAVTVLDDGDGAELCLGGVMESLPPQCGGPKLIGWDWADHGGLYEEVSGTRWGDFAVTGTFDGRDLTVTDVVPAKDAPPYPNDDVDLTTPCPEPDGGWPVPNAADNTIQGTDRAFMRARQLDDYAGSWIDTSRDPRTPEQMDQDAANGADDVSTWIVNVRVTGDIAAAETAIREVWSGALCVTKGEYTERELRRIQDETYDLPGVLSGSSGFDRVEISVVYDDGSIQAWADQEYGAGVVEVTSALVPAD